MKVYVLRCHYSYHGEDFTRGVYMTRKSALLDQCVVLLEVLMDMDWEYEDAREIKIINKIIEKDDPITVGELIQHINVLERYADNVEVYTEVDEFTLQP